MKYKKESANPDKDSQSIQKKSWQDSNNKSESSENFVDNSPLSLFENELKQSWGDLSKSKLMTWNLNTYIGTL